MAEDDPHQEARLLRTLEELLALPALGVEDALMAASQQLAVTLRCDKVDVFLLNAQRQTLEALGTSDTPMGRRQKELGLDSLQLANGGRSVEVFKTGRTFVDGRADLDREEVRGIVEELGVRSSLTAAFQIDAARRGVLSAVSAQTNFFRDSDVRFIEAVAQWVGVLVHRAELVEAARKADVDRARRMRADEIIAVLAHDLRNHLHPLTSRLHLLRLQAASGRPVLPAHLDSALLSVDRLTRLTNDLLDVKRLDEGLFSLNLAVADVARIARDAAASLASPSVAIQVTGLSELTVVADADRLRQAIENVVANAVSYSPPDHPVRVNVSTKRGESGACGMLEIADAGPGINPEVLPRLFQPFASGPGSKGLGLGLYLAHEIARAHGGALKVESQLGLGTTFRLLLPLEAPESSPA